MVIGAPGRLSPAERVQVWEAAVSQHPIDGALTLLALAYPDAGRETIAGLALGDRDAALVAARWRLLGDHIEARYACPRCGEELSLDLSCATLLSGMEPASAPWSLEADGYRVALRPLTSRDAADAAECADRVQARAVLLDRVVVRADGPAGPATAAALPERVVERIAAELARHDPGAEVLLDCLCPACGHTWAELFDVAWFVTDEFAQRGERLLAEVASLARNYGWSEADVLAMSDLRRGAYLGLAQG